MTEQSLERIDLPATGITNPTFLSDQMCSFLGISENSKLSRIEVIKLITKYIKENNLQNPSNKRVIIPDEKLKNLLQLTSTDTLTYFNLGKYLKPHSITAEEHILVKSACKTIV